MNLHGIKLTWLGHATFRIETPGGKSVLIDPWVTGNPMCPAKDKDVKKADVMLCTHGHFDHIADAVETNVFGDMQIIRELYAPEIAMLPIGDHFTMSPREAAYACNLLKPKTVIPMHFGTFPLLTGKPSDLRKLAPEVEVVEMKPGVTIS